MKLSLNGLLCTSRMKGIRILMGEAEYPSDPTLPLEVNLTGKNRQ